jgi:hypothetical protein
MDCLLKYNNTNLKYIELMKKRRFVQKNLEVEKFELTPYFLNIITKAEHEAIFFEIDPGQDRLGYYLKTYDEKKCYVYERIDQFCNTLMSLSIPLETDTTYIQFKDFVFQKNTCASEDENGKKNCRVVVSETDNETFYKNCQIMYGTSVVDPYTPYKGLSIKFCFKDGKYVVKDDVNVKRITTDNPNGPQILQAGWNCLILSENERQEKKLKGNNSLEEKKGKIRYILVTPSIMFVHVECFDAILSISDFLYERFERANDKKRVQYCVDSNVDAHITFLS